MESASAAHRGCYHLPLNIQDYRSNLSSRRYDQPCRLCGGRRLVLCHAEGNACQFPYYRCLDCRLVNYDLSAGLNQEQFARVFQESPG